MIKKPQLKVLWFYYKQFQYINVPLAIFFALFLSADAIDIYLHFLLVFFGLQLTGTMFFTIFIMEHRYRGRYYLYSNMGLSKLYLYGSVFLLNLLIAIISCIIYFLIFKMPARL